MGTLIRAGEVRVSGATPLSEYKELFQKDKALADAWVLNKGPLKDEMDRPDRANSVRADSWRIQSI